jgi:Na+/phosphate symporter
LRAQHKAEAGVQIAIMVGLAVVGFAITFYLTTRVSEQAGRITVGAAAILLGLGAIGFGAGRVADAGMFQALVSDWFAPAVIGMLLGFVLGKRRLRA